MLVWVDAALQTLCSLKGSSQVYDASVECTSQWNFIKTKHSMNFPKIVLITALFFFFLALERSILGRKTDTKDTG